MLIGIVNVLKAILEELGNITTQLTAIAENTTPADSGGGGGSDPEGT